MANRTACFGDRKLYCMKVEQENPSERNEHIILFTHSLVWGDEAACVNVSEHRGFWGLSQRLISGRGRWRERERDIYIYREKEL